MEEVGLASHQELRLNPLSQLRNGREGRGSGGGDGGGNTEEERERERVNCVRDAKSDQMKNEQQTARAAVIDDQNGEERERERERERGEKRTAKGSRKARREGQ